jgi:MarR family transcriptional regulator for hemolysin
MFARADVSARVGDMSAAAASSEAVAACTDARGLEDDLGWALGSVFRAYLKSANAVVADLPGGPRAYQVLAGAARDLPSTQQVLGQRVGIDRSVMTYLVDDLVTAGLVERRPDPADRRARHIVLTDAGRDRLADLDARISQVEAHMLAVLAEGDRETFRTLLFQIARHADQLDPANSACSLVADVERLTSS